MTNNSAKNKRVMQTILVMGFVWIGLALFGMIFDPGRNVIIISQITVGILCLIIFIASKLKKKDT